MPDSVRMTVTRKKGRLSLESPLEIVLRHFGRKVISEKLTRQIRPKTGLSMDDALKRYSPEGAYERAVEARELLTGGLKGKEHLARCKELREIVYGFEDDFNRRLLNAEVLVSAMAEFSTTREIIDRNGFAFLGIAPEFNEIVGGGQSYRAPEFFLASAIPLNIDDIPDWVMDLVESEVFTCSADYSRVTLNGTSIV